MVKIAILSHGLIHNTKVILSLDKALSGQAVLWGRNCENAAKMTLWLCPVILYGYGNAAKSEPAG